MKNKKSTDYQPISCNFYDLLEAAATRRDRVTIRYRGEKGQVLEIEAVITDLRASQGEEFIYLDNGIYFRLDRILSIDGEELKGYC